MSVEAPKPVEDTTVAEPTKAVPEQPESSTAQDETPAAPPAESTEATPAATEETAAATTEESKKDETAAEVVPASEGVLGYKEPHFFKKFIYSKNFFWFQEEPSNPESLTNFIRSEKADTKHSDASWARETGKGLLFYCKRAEDKATPTGIINLSDASTITKEGFNQFYFKSGAHVHRFETATSKERDSWIAAIEKFTEEAKASKEELTGRDSYKKNLEEYSKPASTPANVVKTSRSKSKEPKKSVDAATATDAAATAPTDAEEPTKPTTERSQSRKRGSIFGTLLGKKDESSEKKEEKKAEAAEKKEEAKETKELSKAVEAAEASAVAAVPAAASDKKEGEDASPVEKKGKRGSVFGTLFKNRISSPTAEKSEKDAMATSDVPPVSETAPKIDEPIENKPIDAAAVTAPVDTVAAPVTADEAAKETTTAPAAGESSAAPKPEKKGGLMGFIKKTEAKLEGKKEVKEEDKAPEPISKDPVATEPTDSAPVADASAEAPAAAIEERPARDGKRRTSLFFNKKQSEASEADDTVAEPKREKSPLPAGKFIGQLVRRASKAIKSEGSKEKTPAVEPTVASTTDEAATTETPAVAQEATEPKPSEPVAEPVQSTPEPVAAAALEVKATA